MAERITAASLIAQREEALKWQMDKVKAAKRNRTRTVKTLDLLYQSLATVEDRITIAVWDDVNEYKDDDSVTLYVTVRAEITSMKSGLVPDLMATLLRFDYETVSTADDASAAKRSFRFNRPSSDNFGGIDLTFVATIKEEDTGTCHRVQVGTKTVEIPTYQLICE